MECPKCGYILSAFDVECPRCVLLPRTPHTDATACPDAPPQPAKRARRPQYVLVGIAACVLGLILVASYIGSVRREQAARNAARAAAEHQARLQAEMEARIEAVTVALARKYPRARFLRFPGMGRVARFDAQFAKCGVESVTVSGDSASVRIVGTSREPSAPTVYVSLFDHTGRMIGRAAVVAFVFDHLSPGTMQTVSDCITMSPGSEPAIIGIDEGT